MKFCSTCGALVERRIPPGEDRERYVCGSCGAIHYQNPRMVVGCIVADDDKVLLCRRAIEPRRGYWTMPAGFLELGESSVQGAVRETLEEAGAKVQVIAPYAHFDVPHIGQAYLFYRARMLQAEFAAGPESLEARFVTLGDVPWGELAFPAVQIALELYAQDARSGRYRMHHGVILRQVQGGFALQEHLALPLSD